MANITVTVYDSTENKRVPVELPDDAPANRIIAVLVDKLQLPQNGPDGAPLSYKFHHKNSGRQIQDAQTLADAAVKDAAVSRAWTYEALSSGFFVPSLEYTFELMSTDLTGELETLSVPTLAMGSWHDEDSPQQPLREKMGR